MNTTAQMSAHACRKRIGGTERNMITTAQMSAHACTVTPMNTFEKTLADIAEEYARRMARARDARPRIAEAEALCEAINAHLGENNRLSVCITVHDSCEAFVRLLAFSDFQAVHAAIGLVGLKIECESFKQGEYPGYSETRINLSGIDTPIVLCEPSQQRRAA